MKTHNVIQLFGSPKNSEASKVHHHTSPLQREIFKREQLSLPFSVPHSLMLVMAMDFGGPANFMRFTTTVGVHHILDMRITPRLDFVGANRAQTFKFFESLYIEYKDMLGRVGMKSYEESEDTYRALWKSVVAVLDSIEISNQPIVLFFDNPNFMSQCRHSLSSDYEVVTMSSADIDLISLEEPLRM